ncbi:MAG: energy transducer TonB, partial [Novosphingobium sp.]|uniref:energy transducer TonB n=1 Tax=Novosphingobium sp. TaxID=1874826 RepID=UPI003C7B6E18
LLHLALGYALVTGLAYQGFQAVVKKVTTVDIKKDEPKKEEKPPPPKKEAAPPPIVVPPSKLNLSPPQTNVETTNKAVPPPPPQQLPNLAPPAPAAPPPPPPPAGPTVQAKPKGDPSRWVTNDDYPTRAAREERQGTTGFRLSVSADGRPTGCDITSSSGSPDLDSTACSLLMRRAKFTPAMKDGQPTTGSWGSRFRWVLQDE